MTVPARARGRLPSWLTYAALLAALFLAAGAAGYVYRYDPQHEVVSVRVEPREPDPGPRVVSGTVASIEGDRLTVNTAAGPVTVTMSSSAAVDELVRATDGLPAGTAVNVGVESTQYGLVLTGIVAVEGTR